MNARIKSTYIPTKHYKTFWKSIILGGVYGMFKHQPLLKLMMQENPHLLIEDNSGLVVSLKPSY